MSQPAVRVVWVTSSRAARARRIVAICLARAKPRDDPEEQGLRGFGMGQAPGAGLLDVRAGLSQAAA
jgi:hypothetical protein